jgi:hypothetical protein
MYVRGRVDFPMARMNWSKIADASRMARHGVDPIRGFKIDAPKRKKFKRKWKKTDRVALGQIGKPCDKCNTIMHRFKHRDTPKPNGNKGHYEWWDICLKCGPTHVKHYSEAWRYFNSSRKQYNPWKERVETKVEELERVSKHVTVGDRWQASKENIRMIEEQLTPPWDV